MVEPDVVHLHPGVVQPEHPGHPTAQPGRCVADPQHPVAQHRLHGFGDDAGGIGEVHQVRLRRQLLDQPGDLHHHRHGPDRVRQTARTGGLLADHAEVERDVLVTAATFQTADPDGGEDEVAALDGRPQ